MIVIRITTITATTGPTGAARYKPVIVLTTDQLPTIYDKKKINLRIGDI